MDHEEVSGGARAVAAAAAHGVETMFTLSGAHIFPLHDAAVTAEPPLRLVDVRHEQTAVFAAEAIGKLTRTPGLAALTQPLVERLGRLRVIELDRAATDLLYIYANGTLIAKGEIVSVDGRYGIQIAEVVAPARGLEGLDRRG